MKINKKEWIIIAFGSLLVAFGFQFFLLPSKLVTGGVMGISILVEDILPSWFGVTAFMYALNIILLIVGGIVFGKKFLLRTTFSAILIPSFSLVFDLLFDHDVIYQQLQESPLLVSSIFSGILVGAGLGLVIRNNATTGGIDVIQRIVHKVFKIPFSVSLYLIDGLIILLGFIFGGFELGLYAIASMLITGIILEKVVLIGKSGYTIFIVTNRYEPLKNRIFEAIDRGVTKVNVMGGYQNIPRDMIICTVTQNELYYMKKIVAEVDKNAFMIITKTTEALGEGFSNDHLKY